MPSDVIQTVNHKLLPSKVKPQENTKRIAQIQLNRTQIIETVADILEGMIDERLARYTDASEVTNPTVFHAKKVPSISIKDYLKRFADNSRCHEDAFIYALIYLDRVGENLDDFSLDTLNVYRTILICLASACKFYDDYYYKNSYYAKIGGIKTDEFNNLEQEFLVNYVQFSLYVKPELYAEYYQDLVNYCQARNEDDDAS